MKTLAIETSCDDTSIALVSYEDGIFVVEYMMTVDQLEIHNKYGGVVPQLAYRKHAANIVPLVGDILEKFEKNIVDEIDFISVTSHPGLPGALITGVTAAHTLGSFWDKPVVEVNHIMGHIFSTLIGRSFDDIIFPYLALTVSGGHSDLYLINQKSEVRNQNRDLDINSRDVLVARPHEVTKTITTEKTMLKSQNKNTKSKRQHLVIGEALEVWLFSVTKLGQTIDDAAGEAFDKVARMLWGPYPGGAWIGKLAEQWWPDDRVAFRPSYLKKEEYNVSFSWLKSQAYYLLETYKKEGIELDDTLKANIARAFQEAITDVLVKKSLQCVHEYGAKTLWLVGGVSANKRLREKLQATSWKLKATSNLVLPSEFKYCMDNAGMIGVVGILEVINDKW